MVNPEYGATSGLIGQRLFSVLVLMAVLTTLMTAPLLSLIRPRTDVSPPGDQEPDGTPVLRGSSGPGRAEPRPGHAAGGSLTG